MLKIKHTIKEYQDISADVWIIFKKYFGLPASECMDRVDEYHALDRKYSKNPRLYEFYMKLARVYEQELIELMRLMENEE